MKPDGRRVASPTKLPAVNPVCRRVDELATERNISRTALAAASGTCETTFNRQIRVGKLHADQVAALADKLEVSVHYLLTGFDDWQALAAASFAQAHDKLDKAQKDLERVRDLYLGSCEF